MHFKLRCRYFIEMVRKNAELRQEIELQNKRNGVSTEKMEIDQNGQGTPPSAPMPPLDDEMLEYGSTLQAEFGDSTMANGSGGVLNELWSLMAYENPLQEPHLQHLLDQNGRVMVAEELNVAILCK